MGCIQWQRTETKFIAVKILLRYYFSGTLVSQALFVLILCYPVKCTGRIIYYSDVTWDSFMRYTSIWSGNSGAFPDHGSVAPNILLVPLLNDCIIGLYDYTSAWDLTITDGGNTINSSLPGQNGRQFGRRHSQMHFPEWNVMYFGSNFTKLCS